MRKTKIICTLGPTSDTREKIRELMLAGMDVARINFSHGDYKGHKEKADLVKELRAELGLHTALLLDTKGPEIRLGKFEGGSAELVTGSCFTLYTSEIMGDATKASVSYPGIYRDLHIGSRVLVDDGLIELRVDTVDDEQLNCTVVNGGKVSDRKSVNLPGTVVSLPFISEHDLDDLEFGIREDFDFVAASFTQSAEDVAQIRRELEKRGCRSMRIIAKIENAAGVENIDEILNESDGIMVARGDMGVEIPLEDVPIIQKQLISKCYNAGKQVITATQMLESMTSNPRPTRAETNDVANAIYDGTSAIMLSSETANGKYPVEAVRTMASIALRTESEIDYAQRFRLYSGCLYQNVTNAISHAACTTALDLGASAIITVTKSGQTARLISRFRPVTPIVGCSPDPKICRHMNLSWGVAPALIDELTTTDELLEHAVARAVDIGMLGHGDLAVITAGIPLGVSGTTNMLKVQIVGNVLVSGVGVAPGYVCGTLCVAHDETEARNKFVDGSILVIPEVTPQLIPLLRGAAGIICERGTADSCAAIIGQTLSIPVITEAIDATKILKTGTTVTFDADKGIVCGK
ncbi:MAG: pyruvate kinase [Clostridiales bacterium]|nr:pyruvate kinase [Clostridiales bacterium]